MIAGNACNSDPDMSWHRMMSPGLAGVTTDDITEALFEEDAIIKKEDDINMMI